MKLTELIEAMHAHPDASLTLLLPDGSAVAPHFHVTEVGRVRKDFIDCGGTVRNSDACVLQVWVAEGDEAHRLQASKLGKIIAMSMKVVKDDQLPVEIEHDIGVITQLAVTSIAANDQQITLQLAGKHTACLAPDQCGVDGLSSGTGCCSPSASVVSLGINQGKCC